MLSHDSGSSLLASGGSIVTRISPDKQDWSAVIEKMTTKVRYLSPISGITDLSIIVGELIISFFELLGPEFQR
jgi:hypothetical protein